MILKTVEKIESIGELANYPGKFRVRFYLSDELGLFSCILSTKQANRLQTDMREGGSLWVVLDHTQGEKAQQYPYRWVWSATSPDWLKSSFIDNPRAPNPKYQAAPQPAQTFTPKTLPPVAELTEDDIPF